MLENTREYTKEKELGIYHYLDFSWGNIEKKNLDI